MLRHACSGAAATAAAAAGGAAAAAAGQLPLQVSLHSSSWSQHSTTQWPNHEVPYDVAVTVWRQYPQQLAPYLTRARAAPSLCAISHVKKAPPPVAHCVSHRSGSHRSVTRSEHSPPRPTLQNQPELSHRPLPSNKRVRATIQLKDPFARPHTVAAAEPRIVNSSHDTLIGVSPRAGFLAQSRARFATEHTYSQQLLRTTGRGGVSQRGGGSPLPTERAALSTASIDRCPATELQHLLSGALRTIGTSPE